LFKVAKNTVNAGPSATFAEFVQDEEGPEPAHHAYVLLTFRTSPGSGAPNSVPVFFSHIRPAAGSLTVPSPLSMKRDAAACGLFAFAVSAPSHNHATDNPTTLNVSFRMADSVDSESIFEMRTATGHRQDLDRKALPRRDNRIAVGTRLRHHDAPPTACAARLTKML
jgi:hypothetical protein